MKHIVIIGNGIAGVTTAIHVRKKSNHEITIISSETKYFYSRTALMYVFMGHMKFEHTQPFENDFWDKQNINLLQAQVQQINTTSKSLILDNKQNISYDQLVIATGSKPNKFGWKGENLEGVTGLYHKQDVELLNQLAVNCKHAVVVGGGLIGIELAEMLHSRGIRVTFLVRETSFWNNVLPIEESELINRHIVEHKIDLRLSTGLSEIIADENGRAKAIVTDKGETINCEIIGLTTGVSPNIEFLKSSSIKLSRGVLVNRYLETNIKDVFAIGDCAEQLEGIGLRRPIEAVWYTGRMMGETLAQTLTGNPTIYNPGHWFNSAKFFDIEYQTYGWVFAKPIENEKHFYWEHPSGKKAIRIAYHTKDNTFLGINSFGIRLRHEFFNDVLNKKESVDFVINQLQKANFDPEFFTQYHQEIKLQFNHFIKTN